MTSYSLKKYVEEDGSSDLVEWYNNLSDDGQGAFAARVEHYCGLQNTVGWSMPWFRPLESGISEFRFKDKRVQQRPLGYFGPGTKEYCFLYPAIEKGDQFIPKDAIQRAISRKTIAEEDPRRSNVWDIKVI